MWGSAQPPRVLLLAAHPPVGAQPFSLKLHQLRCAACFLIHLTCLGKFSPNTARDDFTFHSRYLSFKENVINAN